MSDKQLENLFNKIENKKLLVNQRNADLVKEAYLETSKWKAFFSLSGLHWLPDPSRLFTDGPVLFENWLVDAYRNNFNTKKECRSAFRNAIKLSVKEFAK